MRILSRPNEHSRLVFVVGIFILAGLPVIVAGVLGRIGARRLGPLRALAALLVALTIATLTAWVLLPATWGPSELLMAVVVAGIGVGSVRARGVGDCARTFTNSKDNPVGALLNLSDRLADDLGAPRNQTLARPQ